MKHPVRVLLAASPLLLAVTACGSGDGASPGGSADGGGGGDDGGAYSSGDSSIAPVADGGGSGADTEAGSTSDTGAVAVDSGGGDDAQPDGPAVDAAKCAPSCGAALCGDDGCGGSCGTCAGADWCGGGGTAGQCGSSSAIAPYPGITPTQVDNGAALGLRVSGDEAHVLVQRTEVTQGPNEFAQGALAVVTVAPSGSGTAVELTTAVPFVNGRPKADFTADSSALFFVDAAVTPNRLVVAAASGAGAHAVATGIVQTAVLGGTTLVYALDASDGSGNEEVWGVTLPSGTPVRLVASGAIEYPVLTPNATGTTVLVINDTATVYQLIQTANAATLTVGPAGQSVTGAAWSPDGARLAYWIVQPSEQRALHVVNADGTGDVVLTTANVSEPAFSPDGHRLAYDVAGAGGKVASVTVHDFAGAPDITLTASTARTWEALAFSPDGADLVMTSLENTLAAAPAAHAGAFVELGASLSQTEPSAPPLALCAIAAGDVAVLLGGRAVSVLPVTGGASTTLAVPVDDLPFYEPVATTPRLLAFTLTTASESGIPGSLVFFPTGGSGAATTLPGSVLPAITLGQLWHSAPLGWQGPDSGAGQVSEPFTWGWLGSEIVYETDRGQGATGTALDVVAATDDAGTVGVIAPGAQVWAVRDAGTPSRTHFTRPSQNGVWVSKVPQTPGR